MDDRALDQQAFPVVQCPGCQMAMRVIASDAGLNELHTVTYRCDGCGTETQRLFKRDASAITNERPIGTLSGRATALDQQVFPVVQCPGCQMAMRVVASEAGPNELNTVTYKCESCGTETQRLLKRDA
jgi:DNA-directed RNA polymerase subunit RPC12/RpoP